MWFEFASGQIQGKRTAQEDAVELLVLGDRAAPPGCTTRLVVAIADGMGGHVGGRIASSIVSKQFLEALGPEPVWAEAAERALEHANAALKSATEKRPDLDGMGSTLVGAEICPEGLAWVSIGDTGLFLIRDGRFERLNEDHSFGAYLDDQAAKGLITPEAAATDRRRNQLFHALLGDPLEHFERQRPARSLQPGDVVILATDGLNTLPDAEIAAFLRDNPDLSPVDITDWLLRSVEAIDRPRQDNATVFVICARSGEMPDGPSISRIVSPFLLGRAVTSRPSGRPVVEEPVTDVIRPPKPPPPAEPVLAPIIPPLPVAVEAEPRSNPWLVSLLSVLTVLMIGIVWYVLSR